MRSGQPNMAPTFDPRLAVLMVGAAQIICGISSQTEAFLCGFSVFVPVWECRCNGHHLVPESWPEHWHEVEQRTQLCRCFRKFCSVFLHYGSGGKGV